MDVLILILILALNALIVLGIGFWIAFGFCRGLERAREPEVQVTPMPLFRAFWSRFRWSTFPLCVAWVLVMALFSFAVGMGTDVEWGYYPPRVVALRALDFFGLMLTPLLLYLAGCIVLAPRLTNPFFLTLVLVPATGLLTWGMLALTDRWMHAVVIEMPRTGETFSVVVDFLAMGAVSLLIFASTLIWAWRQGASWFRLGI